jgi:hypothetical protein
MAKKAAISWERAYYVLQIRHTARLFPMPNRFFVLAIAATIVAGFDVNQASAHDLRGRITLLPESIKVEAWFSDDTPAEGAQVSIKDDKGAEVARGKTDETGICLIPKLKPGAYEAEIDLIGHRDAIRFDVSDESNMLEFSGWRMNQTLGLTIGISLLLGVSSLFWLLRQRRSQKY